MTTEVLKKDEAIRDDVAPTPMTRNQLSARIDADSKFAEAYLADPAKYNAMVVKAPATADVAPTPAPAQPGTQSPAAAPGTQTPPPAQSVEEVEIRARIPRDLLGSYAVNRSESEAVVEALKGIREKDTLIAYLRQRNEESTGERLNLKRELERFKAQPPANPPQRAESVQPRPDSKAAPIPSADDFDPESIPEDEAIFDPENTKKLVRGVKSLARQNKELTAQVQAAKDGTQRILSESERVASEQTARAAVERSLNDEFQQIADLQSDVPELKTSKPFRMVDQEVAQFIRDVGHVAGTGGGDYNEAALAATRRFFDDKTPEGDALRKRCSDAGVKPPEEYVKHGEIIRVRAERNKYRSRVVEQLRAKGKEISESDVDAPFTYTQVYHSLRSPDVSRQLTAARVDGAQAAARASQATQTAAREIPPDAGSPAIDFATVKKSTISALLDKKTELLTPAEKALLTQYYASRKIPAPWDK